MGLTGISKCLLTLLICAAPVAAQDRDFYWSPRVFLDSDVGVAAELGFIPPSTDLGMSFELPLTRRVEVQGRASFSPTKKKITDDGYAISASSTGILWINSSVGALGKVEYDRLWTSQFNEHGTAPSFGAVLRIHYYGFPGRLYLDYLIPSGCVWATPSNPCALQSKRIQGPEVALEYQLWPHVRMGIRGGLFHFCDQSNQNDPTAGRNCHLAASEFLFVRFQFPRWKEGSY